MSQRRKRSAPVVSEEESRLQQLLFGSSVAVAPRASVALSSAAASAPATASAWRDEDDEQVAVDLRGSARLRKLRRTPEEGVVSGGELASRLRGRHESTVGAGSEGVAWAKVPSKKAGKKKRSRAVKGGYDEDDGEDEGLEEGEGEEEGDEEEGGLGDLLATTGRLTQGSRALPSTTLSLARQKDANLVDPARSPIRALAWHPTPGMGVLCTGSGDARLRFFRCDGKVNSRVASVLLPDLPVHSAGWTGDGLEVIATGRRPFYYAYDVGAGTAQRVGRMKGREEASLESAVISPSPYTSDTALLAFLGNDGVTILASARTKQWVGNLASGEGSVRAGAFSRGPTGGGGGAGALDFPEYLSVGSHGIVSRWCLRTLKCLARYRDEGSTGGTAIAAHPSGTRFAVGSTMGVVNEYDLYGGEGGEGEEGGGGGGGATRAGGGGSRRGGGGGLSHLFVGTPAPLKPIHTYMHLTTAIDHLSYGGGVGGEILAFSSTRTRDSLRLAHSSTGTVFSNWPTSSTPLSILTAGVAISPGGAFLATGNDKGRALLYRLNHFKEV